MAIAKVICSPNLTIIVLGDQIRFTLFPINLTFTVTIPAKKLRMNFEGGGDKGSSLGLRNHNRKRHCIPWSLSPGNSDSIRITVENHQWRTQDV